MGIDYASAAGGCWCGLTQVFFVRARTTLIPPQRPPSFQEGRSPEVSQDLLGLINPGEVML